MSENIQSSIPIVKFLNSIVVSVAKTTAWFNVVLIVVILLQVVLRYGFNNGMVVLEELIWHFYAIAFMFGMAYAITSDSHIRVDLIHLNLSQKTQSIIEVLGIVILLMPTLLIVFDHSFDWVLESYRVLESSSSPTGLPYRWIVKSVLPMTMVLMFIAAVAKLIEHLFVLIFKGAPSDEAMTKATVL